MTFRNRGYDRPKIAAKFFHRILENQANANALLDLDGMLRQKVIERLARYA